ncbi:type II secretion system protein [Patescibacteria group bacterium]
MNKFNCSKIKKNGFTIMELIVVIGLFMTSVLIITEILMMINKSQKNIMEYQKLQSDVSYTLEVIARSIRLGTIDYASYSLGISNPEDELYLFDVNGKQTIFKLANNQAEGCTTNNSSPCVIEGVDTDVDGVVDYYGAITPKGVKINSLKFYITPTNNPFLSRQCAVVGDCPSAVCLASGFCQVPDQQPMVTIIISAEQSETIVSNPATISLQTTVSSRQYYR